MPYRRLALSVLVTAALSAAEPLDAELAALERVILAPDRAAAVAALPLGSREREWHEALLLQHAGRLAEAEKLIESIARRDGDAATRLRWRQALLLWGTDKAAATARLRELAGAPTAGDGPAAAADGLPSALDPQLLDGARLLAEALRSNSFDGLTAEGLRQVAVATLDGKQARALLDQLGEPRHPQLERLLAKAFAADDAPSFGSLRLRAQLGRPLLERLVTQVPRLRGDRDYVETWLEARLAEDGAEAESPDRRLARAGDLARFAAGLPAAAAPLRRAAAWWRLRLDDEAGRPVAEALRAWLAQERIAAEAEAKGTPGWPAPERIGLPVPPAHETRPWAERCLLDQLAGLADPGAWAELVEAGELTRLHQRARLGAGQPVTVADGALVERWRNQAELAVLGAEGRRRPGAAVELTVAASGAKSLLVRIYPLDPLQVARNPSAVRPYMDRDACIPAVERSIALPGDTLRRHRLPLPLPEIAGAGSWLVELIAGDRRLEAVVRVGWLDALPVAGGYLVLDEQGRPCPGAQGRHRGQAFTADANGLLRLPRLPWDASDPETAPLQLVHQGRALGLAHRSEPHSAALTASLAIDQEQLAGGATATGLLRWRLDLDGRRADAILREGRLTVTTVDADEATTSSEHTLAGDPRTSEQEIAIPLPRRLAGLSWRLQGWISVPEGRREVSADGTLAAGRIRTTRQLDDLRLLGDADGFNLLVLGRGGQPRSDRAVKLELTHRWLTQPLRVHLLSDRQGLIRLGRLPLVSVLRVDDENRRFFLPPGPEQSVSAWDGEAVLPAGGTLRLLLPDAAGAALWRLAGDGRRLQEPVADAIRQDGAASVVGPLPPGRYRLLHAHGAKELSVATGAAGPDPDGRGAILLTDAHGAARATPAAPLALRLERDGADLVITVNGAEAATRVHVFARRTLDAGAALPDQHPGAEDWPLHPLAGQLGGACTLGEEEAYRLARHTRAALPGVLLERPALAMRPWHDPDFEIIGADGGGNGSFGMRSGGGRKRAVGRAGGSQACEDVGSVALADPDLQPAPSALLANLRPDAAGRLRIPLARLGAAGFVRVVACSAEASAGAALALPPQPVAWRDLRHQQALPPDRPHVLVREAQVLPAGGDPMPPPGTLRQRVFAGADQVFDWFRARGELELKDLQVLAQWDRLDAAARRRSYGAIAGHEADLWLARHDPAFFAAVIRPLLSDLLQPRLVDDLLAGTDPARWLEPHALAALNAAELALLARAAPAAATRLRAMLADRSAGDDEERREAEALRRAAVAIDVPLPAAAPAPEPAPAPAPKPEAKLERALEAEAAKDAVAEQAEAQLALELDATRRPGASDPRTLTDRGWYLVGAKRTVPELVPANRFWRELAAADPARGVLTPALLAVEGSRAAVVAAIACSELPLHAPAADAQGRLPSAALLVRERVQPVAAAPAEGLVVDGAVFAEGEDEPVGPQLLPWRPYILRWRIVEMAGRRRTVDLLAEVPAGAVALAGEGRMSATIVVEPYGSQNVELPFFLVDPGAHPCFPLHVAERGRLLAAGGDLRLAVAPPGADDGRWWTGTPEAIAARLAAQRGDRLDAALAQVAHRLAEPAVWRAVAVALEARGAFRTEVWAWALEHGDEARLRQWLRLDPTVAEWLGGAIRSPLLTLLPLPERTLIHLDIADVVNPRWHQEPGTLPQEPLVAARWREVLAQAALLPAPDDALELEIAYLLLLQDRLDESAAWLARVAPAAPWKTQLAYLGAWLALARGDAANAARAAAPLLTADLAPPWSSRRDALATHLAALGAIPKRAGGTGERPLDQALERAAQAPALEAELDGAAIAVRARSLTAVEVRLHAIDLEAAFLDRPFVRQAQDVPKMAPSAVLPLAPTADGGTVRVAIPAELARKALLVVVAGGGLERVLLYSGAALDLRVAAADGLLVVCDRAGKPVPAAYVRVHSEAGFVRDGRTDLLGRFDLRARPGTPQKLAVYVEAEGLGAAVRTVE